MENQDNCCIKKKKILKSFDYSSGKKLTSKQINYINKNMIVNPNCESCMLFIKVLKKTVIFKCVNCSNIIINNSSNKECDNCYKYKTKNLILNFARIMCIIYLGCYMFFIGSKIFTPHQL